MTKILFVCLGNICRSVALQAVLAHLAKQEGLEGNLYVDSCGLGWWHIGEDPDFRIAQILREKGIELEHKAREIESSDFDTFDYIIAATKEILRDLQNFAQTESRKKKIYLACDFSEKHKGEDMPDPYYGNKGDFEKIVTLSEEISKGILRKIPSKG
jgi:protein-tyrosine phosphatase